MEVYRKRVFPSLAGALWAWFLFLDLTRRGGSTPVKFAGICLCLVTALPGAKTLDGKLVAAALAFTVCADWFLLVRDDHYPLGVVLFLVVQALYACRLRRLRGRPTPVLYLRLSLVLLWGAFSLIEPTVFQLWCVLLYFSNLCLNCAEAFALGYGNGRNAPGGNVPLVRRFAWGLLLFLCCDLCVGLWNVSLFLPAALSEFARVGMWLFYLPSQVLIVLSQAMEGDAP